MSEHIGGAMKSIPASRSILLFLSVLSITVSEYALGSMSGEGEVPVSQCEELSRAVYSDDFNMLQFSIGLTDEDIDGVENCLSSNPSDELALNLLAALTYTGRPGAVDIIESEICSREGVIWDLLFVRSIPSSPSESRMEILSELSRGPWIGDRASITSQSIIGLGLLDSFDDESYLEHVEKAGLGTYSGRVAGAVLKWISERDSEVNVIAAGESDEWLVPILERAAPELYHLGHLCEQSDTKRTWERSGNGWNIGLGCGEASRGKVVLEPHISSDRRRAIVRVNISSGPHYGASYIYVMHRSDSSWRVVGLWRGLVV